MSTRLQALRDLTHRDPEGWAREPSDTDREAFRLWAIDTYGRAIWQAYCTENWIA
jgi:hypothetical protein